MNVHDGTLSDLLFDEDDDFIDAIEEAVERLSRITKDGEFIDDPEYCTKKRRGDQYGYKANTV